MTSEIFNLDCMQGMKQYPDKYFDLAVVDPPYGQTWGNLYQITSGRTDLLEKHFTEARKWDVKPTKEYFEELKRVSQKQIIWGYSYFTDILGNSNDLIIWDKQITGNKNFLRFEIAYCSFNVSEIIQALKTKNEPKEHPTQKPIALYDWTFMNYAKQGDKILDTHLGSGSSRISAHKAGLDFVGYELDKDYFDASEKRFQIYLRQQDLFMEKVA